MVCLEEVAAELGKRSGENPAHTASAELVGVNKETALSPQALASAIETQGITSMFVTTALFLLMAKEAPRSLRHQLTGGEALSPSRMREALTHSIGNGPGEA